MVTLRCGWRECNASAGSAVRAGKVLLAANPPPAKSAGSGFALVGLGVRVPRLPVSMQSAPLHGHLQAARL
jgi:hypothetical protein